jgi:hypothetical protein
MAETNLNITTRSDDAGLKSLVDQLNNTDMTVKQLKKTLADYNSSLIAGSQAQKDFNDVRTQAMNQMKSEMQVQNSLTNVIRESRQERRLYMFAVTESLHAIDGAIGKDNELSKAVTGAAGAFFGVKFAVDAMGKSFAAFSLPLAIITAAWTVIKKLWDDSADSLSKDDEKLGGVLSGLTKIAELREKLGMKTPEQTLATLERISQQKFIEYQHTLVEAEDDATNENVIKSYGEYLSSLDAIKEKMKSINDEKERENKEWTKQHTTSPLLESSEAQNTLNQLNTATREKTSGILGARVGEKNVLPVGGVGEGNAQPLDTQLSVLQKLYGTLAIATEKWNDQFNTTNLLIEGFDQAIGGVSNKWTNAVQGMIEGTQNIGQAFKNMGMAVVQELEQIIARIITMEILGSILGLFTGGVSTILTDATAGIPSLSNPGGVGLPSVGAIPQSSSVTAQALQNLSNKLTPMSGQDLYFTLKTTGRQRGGAIM